MKSQKFRTRLIVSLAAVSLVTGGLFLTNSHLNNKIVDDGSATVEASAKTEGKPTDLLTLREQRRQQAEKFASYTNTASGERLEIALDHAAIQDADGRYEIITLDPVATTETLKERLAAISSPNGVSPVAYRNGANQSPEGRAIITSRIRAQVPREQAERLASEHGLRIVEFPTYAPEWVIFDAANPIDALEKIGGVRTETGVDSADILVTREYVLMDMPNDPLVGDQWYLKRSNGAAAGTDINVEDVWKYNETGGIRGVGVNIGIIDTGTQTNHPDFVGNINTEIDWDYFSGDADPSPVYSYEEHGTAVSGVAAARGNNGLGVSGVAPEATIVALRLLGERRTPLTDDQIAGALAHRNDIIQIKNNSWGSNMPFYTLEPLEAAALKNSVVTGRGGKGTIFTFAAGNSGDEEDSANYSELTSSIYTIAVGATDSRGRRAYYSEPGANLVITAPSNGFQGSLGITTTDQTGADGYNQTPGVDGNYTDDFSGTSSSCPVISGVIALMLEANPDLGWRDVQDILIRTATRFNPTADGWLTNAAGLHFNNDYGAGLVDATAAVNMAAGRATTLDYLAPQQTAVSSQIGINQLIRNNASAGTIVEFEMPTSNLITEHVTLKVDITHNARGELEIFLISPSGTESHLAVTRSDLDDNYENYTFSTVQNWGENSSGVWTLRVADRSNATNRTGGLLKSAELTVYGVTAPPVNPAPIVRINNPVTDTLFSPGVGFNVDVEVSDFDIDGNPDTVTGVDLYENGVIVATSPTAPFSFPRNPAEGTYIYLARATDPDGKEGTSLPITVTVINQTPVIHSAIVNATGQAYDDEPLIVSAVNATDPEMEPITLTYQWEFSTDQETYVADPTKNTNTLAPESANSGKIWRCRITASDGNTTSEPFFTQPVNLLDRPLGNAVPRGDSYSYQSGLVLRGDQMSVARQAIIHEFSQGPPGGTSEWIEILTLRQGSLTNWRLFDGDGNQLTFADIPEWANIPAGTLIVIYNGNADKDPLIPADTVDPSSGRMIISSKNETYFEPASKWPGFSNGGDSVILGSPTIDRVHHVSYGANNISSPNIGEVPSGKAAYFVGETDAGASRASEWLVTSATVRRTPTSTFSAGEYSIFPPVVLTNGRYTQNFNTLPGEDGNYFPRGWSAYTTNVARTSTINVDEMDVFQANSPAGNVFNFGSKVGIFGGNNRFDPGFIALGIDNTQNATGLKISYDLVKMSEQSRSVDVRLQYTVGNPGNTGTIWTDIQGGSHKSGSTPIGTVNKYVNVPLPPIFTDRVSPIYLRWYYNTSGNNTGTGGRDAIAIDNVVISSDQSPNILLGLTLNPSTISEAAGVNASTGTITLSKVLTTDLTVSISSSDTTEATVPDSVVIPAGQISVTFPINAIDDRFSDGPQSVIIRVSAPDFSDNTAILTVTDDEPPLIGVTPGYGNNPANSFFVQRLRENRINEPATFRLATGSVLPEGLTLNPVTGLISGTISPNATPGAYPITIELTNIRFESTSQSIVINVSASGSFTYSAWISLFGLSDITAKGDPDFDQLPNLVEYAINSLPGAHEQPSPVLLEQTATEISLTFNREKGRNVSLVAEWSTTMLAGSWQTSGITETVLQDSPERQKIKASLPIVPGDPARFMRLKATEINPQ